jgi:hypothetical protein
LSIFQVTSPQKIPSKGDSSSSGRNHDSSNAAENSVRTRREGQRKLHAERSLDAQDLVVRGRCGDRESPGVTTKALTSLERRLAVPTPFLEAWHGFLDIFLRL